MSCACAGKGLFQVNYRDGSAPDLAICRCPSGASYRRWFEASEDILRAQLRLAPDQQLGLLEQFSDEEGSLADVFGPIAAEPDFMAAGKTQLRAKL